MPKYRLEPDENLMQFAARFGVTVNDIWNHSENTDLKNRFGNPWLVGPGEEITVPEKPGTGRKAMTGKLQKFQAIPPPDIIDVYLGFMDEEVNARLAKLIENEDKKGDKNKVRPVILIERGKLSEDEPILEWRLGNYNIGEKETPIHRILHVSPQEIKGASEGESIAPEDLIARMTAIYMVDAVGADKELKGKKITVCKNCGLSRSAVEKYCEHCGISYSSNVCETCGLPRSQFDIKGEGCKFGRPHVWKKCTGDNIHKWKEPAGYDRNKECKSPEAPSRKHVWVEQTGVEFRRAFDLLELIGHRKPGKSKSDVPKSEAEIGDGPWLSVVRFDIGPKEYDKPKDIRAPIIVIRTPEMGLQPSLMQPYIEFLIKCISGAASQLAAAKAEKLELIDRETEAGEIKPPWDIWEWPLRVFQFGAQGSCSAQEKYSPGKIITVIASLFVGVDIDRNGNIWSVISLCTPGGIYEFVRIKSDSGGGKEKLVSDAEKIAMDKFHRQADGKNFDELKLSRENIHRVPNNPYKNAEDVINEGDTLKETIDKIYEIYKDIYPKDSTPPGAVTLTVSYFGGEEDKNAADNLGIYSVGMEDYHVLRILRSAFCQGISSSTDYPIVLGWRIDRVQCDPKEIDKEVQDEFDAYIRRVDDRQGPTALLTAEEYANIIAWGLKGLLTTAMPPCTRWNFIEHYWKKGKKWRKLLKEHFWSFTYYGFWKDWTFGGLRELRFKVPNPFHIEIATDLLNDLSGMKPGITGEIKDTDAGGKNVRDEIKKLAGAVILAWKDEEKNKGQYRESKGSVMSKKPLRIEEKDYIGPGGEKTKKAAIKLMEYVGENCGFDSGKKRNGKPLLKTWLRPNKWGLYPNFVKEAATQDLKDSSNPKFDGACVDRAFYKSCNMMALQTMAGNLWDIYEPMEAERSEIE